MRRRGASGRRPAAVALAELHTRGGVAWAQRRGIFLGCVDWEEEDESRGERPDRTTAGGQIERLGADRPAPSAGLRVYVDSQKKRIY